MKRKFLMSMLLMLSLYCGLTPLSTNAAQQEQPTNCISPKIVKLQGDLQKLWIDHVIWTRSYVVSALAGLEDQQAVLERLLRNQQDIGDAIKPYYGESAGNKLAELLREHIVIAGKVVSAANSGNQAEFKKFNNEWHRNAVEIAKFLSSANPNWAQNMMQDQLFTHLKLLTDLVTARIAKDWKAEIAAFDKGEEHIIMFADILTDGIIKQFPEKFR